VRTSASDRSLLSHTLPPCWGGCAESLMPPGRQLHRSGTYLCMEGRPFSTRAESNLLYRSWGCSVIGLTQPQRGAPPGPGSRDWPTPTPPPWSRTTDCWHAEHASVTVDLVVDNSRQRRVGPTDRAMDCRADWLFKGSSSSRPTALRSALMRPKEACARPHPWSASTCSPAPTGPFQRKRHKTDRDAGKGSAIGRLSGVGKREALPASRAGRSLPLAVTRSLAGVSFGRSAHGGHQQGR